MTAEDEISLVAGHLRPVVDDCLDALTLECIDVVGADFTEDQLQHPLTKALPHLEPYVEAVLARRRRQNRGSDPVSRSERKTGVKHTEVVTSQLVQDERGWLRLAG